jgi:hypothetical protein
VYHYGSHNRQGHSARTWGPLYRFDPHRRDSAGNAQADPDGRSVVYVAGDLATGLCEVFGESGVAQVCPRYRVAIVEPTTPTVLFDLCTPGAAMAIGALPALADGNEARELTQQWAQAIYEDQPAHRRVDGIKYRSAYNGGVSLALWDSDERVRTLIRRGNAADYALDSSALLPRVTVDLDLRRIRLERVDSVNCTSCQKDPSP